MKCELCNHQTQLLTPVSTFTTYGIRVCHDCERLIRKHKSKPYSQVMDAVAQAEAGYYINRKIARRF